MRIQLTVISRLHFCPSIFATKENIAENRLTVEEPIQRLLVGFNGSNNWNILILFIYQVRCEGINGSRRLERFLAASLSHACKLLRFLYSGSLLLII